MSMFLDGSSSNRTAGRMGGRGRACCCWSSSIFLILGGRPSRGPSQSRDLLGLPTFPLRRGGVGVGAVFTSLCQSCSHTKLPANM